MSNLTPPIVDLAGEIQHNVAIIQKFLSDHSIPPLSFAPDAFPFFPGTGPAELDPFPAPDQAVVQARASLQQACETLLLLTTSPAEHMIYYMCQYHSTTCLQYVYHFRVAEKVPAEGAISYAELAGVTGLDEGQLKRVIRYMITTNYFQEPKPEFVAHTAGSKLLLAMKDTVGYITEESFPGGSQISAATEKFPQSQERYHASWNLAHNVDRPIFDFFESNPERRTRFLGNMANLGRSEGWNIKHLLNGYDWKAIGKGTVVDIGGNLGHASVAIAEVASELHFVVQDLENAAKDAKYYSQGRMPAAVEFQVHDFFTTQSVKNAEVYLLRFILHDYPDKYAAQILRNIVPAMGPKSRLIIMDGVVPDPGVVTKVDERRMRLMDLEMMLTFNAVERDIKGWSSLFAKADERLELKKIVTPVGSAQSIMEVVMKDT